MPIATPQGTLDFKSVDKVTFVGASSNTVIDTTTGSLGVGVGVNGPTSNLHVVGHTRLEGDIDMLHTANTASIKLNSNVVTEFPRSKKLIKYPRVALTSAQSGLSGGYTQDGYTVEASSELTESGVLYATSNAFNSIQAYQPTDYAWSSGANRYGTGGLASNGTSKDTFQGVDGSWLGLTLPNAIRLEHIHLYNRAENTGHVCPAKSGIIWASNDGTSWYRILSFDNLDKTDGALNVLQVNSVNFYTRYRVQITANNPDPVKTAVMIGELEFYGVPEYDPEAAGLDVKVTSYPNVPNTDWLEVYYDAKGLENDSTTVNDLKPVGTANNGTVGGNTSVTDEAFTFDGTGDYITSTVTTGTGNQSFSVACWFKFTTLGGLLWGFTGTTNGTGSSNPTDNSTPHAYFNTTGSINFDFWANATVTAEKLIEASRWYAGVWTYDGTTRKIYIDGTQVHLPQSSTPLSIIDNTSRLSIGIYPTNLSGGPMTGSVANFRFFNRALTTDEIYQLYAYQKEYFGHGHLSMTLKAGRLGIGTSEPRALLDVKGDTFSKVYKGGRTTFLTWDYVGQRYVDISAANHSTYANEGNILDHTFDIPSCYHDLGTATLKAFVQIDWRGEVNKPWNFGFRIEVTYNGDQIAYSSSSDHAASLNSRVCGTPMDSYHDDHYSTPEHASVTSLFNLSNCDVSPGSKLKVQLVGQWGDSSLSQRIWTGRTHGNINRADYELPTSSFFVVLDVDDGY